MADISQIKLPGDNTPHNLVDATARTSIGTSYNNSVVPSEQRLSAATAQGAIDELVQRVWRGTQAAYDALPSHDPNIVYYITDGTNPTSSLPIAILRFSSTDSMSAWTSGPVTYTNSELFDGYGNVLAPLDLLDSTTKELIYDLRIEYVQLDSTTLLPKNRYIFNTISAQKMGNSSIYTISCNMIWESMRVFGNIGYTTSPSPHYEGTFSIINIPTNATVLPITGSSAVGTYTYIENKFKYSTTERLLGVWVDNKQIFEKTFEITGSLAAVGDWTVFDESVSYDTLISMEGIRYTLSGEYIPFTQTLYTNPRFSVQDNHKLFYYSGEEIGASKIYITVRYTKAT